MPRGTTRAARATLGMTSPAQKSPSGRAQKPSERLEAQIQSQRRRVPISELRPGSQDWGPVPMKRVTGMSSHFPQALLQGFGRSRQPSLPGRKSRAPKEERSCSRFHTPACAAVSRTVRPSAPRPALPPSVLPACEMALDESLPLAFLLSPRVQSGLSDAYLDPL